MDDQASAFFETQFRRLTGYASYPWQSTLFQRFISGPIDDCVDLPTGSGKTSIMAVWLLALAWQSKCAGITLPRRLVWVVNRRVVVDQATRDAERYRGVLSELSQDDELWRALHPISATGNSLLAISTLRGELADNGEWSEDPSRPAIIIGTVDKIGSGLLFSGYGDGPYWRPQRAGLLAVDSLVVNDEAHLTPAFVKLLQSISDRHPAGGIPGKSFRFLSLSATQNGQHKGKAFPESLDEDVAKSEEFARRYTADKRLYLHQQQVRKKLDLKILELANRPGALRTIVFIEQPEEALKVFERLELLHAGKVALLTGTMRGLERDRLAEHDVVFGRFLTMEPPPEPAWLVTTSAGEVGIDMTSDRLITSLVSADHLIQRFGRLNRWGRSRGEAHIVYTPVPEKEARLRATLTYLQSLPRLEDGVDIRPCTVRASAPPPDAQTELPMMARLHDWNIELWCQTSGRVKGYPRVEPWLHGKQDNYGETEIAWRADVPHLTTDAFSTADRARVFRYYSVRSHEKLKEPTYRVIEKLSALAKDQPDTKVLVRLPDARVEVRSLEAATKSKDLAYALILLPPGCGGLTHGMFSTSASTAGSVNCDVADRIVGGQPDRRRYLEDGDGRFDPLVIREGDPALNRQTGRVIAEFALTDPENTDVEQERIVYLRQKKPGSNPTAPYALDVHQTDVAERARRLAERLVPDLVAEFVRSGELHDHGKGSPIWQSAMGRSRDGTVVAKPFDVSRPKQLGGYRHEVGSLRHVRSIPLAEVNRDLVLHLIAAHHGHARPHFSDAAADIRSLKESYEVTQETPLRFGRLVERWGPWGLAYLEAILKAADGWASGDAESGYKVEPQTEEEGEEAGETA